MFYDMSTVNAYPNSRNTLNNNFIRMVTGRDILRKSCAIAGILPQSKLKNLYLHFIFSAILLIALQTLLVNTQKLASALCAQTLSSSRLTFTSPLSVLRRCVRQSEHLASVGFPFHREAVLVANILAQVGQGSSKHDAGASGAWSDHVRGDCYVTINELRNSTATQNPPSFTIRIQDPRKPQIQISYKRLPHTLVS